MSAARHGWASASALLATLLTLACAVTAATAPDAAGLYLDEETIPGKPYSLLGEDELGAAHPNVVHRIYLHAGQHVEFALGGGGGVDGDLYLYPPSANDFTAAPVASSVTGGSVDEYMTYFVPSSGWYYVRVRRASGDGWCTLAVNPQWPAPTGPATPQRLWGADRYETACAIAEMNFPAWRNVRPRDHRERGGSCRRRSALGKWSDMGLWRADPARAARQNAGVCHRGAAGDARSQRAVPPAHRGRSGLGRAGGPSRHRGQRAPT